MIQNKLPISVSEFISKIQFVIEYNPEFENIVIKGEISNLRISNSGHKYFNLIDEFSSIKCVLFRGNKDINTPEENVEVIIAGQVSIYKQRGDLQIIIKSVSLKKSFQAIVQQILRYSHPLLFHRVNRYSI